LVTLTDKALIDRVKLGDEAAFEYLLERYEPFVAKIARSYFIDGFEREDLFQIGTASFYRAVLTYSEEIDSTFYAYALSCVRNEFVSMCRKHLAQDEYVMLYEDMAMVMEAQGMYTAPTSVLLDEVDNPILHQYRLDLKALLAEDSFLSELEKACLEQFAYNLGRIEIAEKLNVDIKRVDNALTRIRIKLRKRAP